MTWLCRVCMKKAKYIADFATSALNKQKKYSVTRNGYCELHKPIVLTIKEYNKLMRKYNKQQKLEVKKC